MKGIEYKLELFKGSTIEEIFLPEAELAFNKEKGFMRAFEIDKKTAAKRYEGAEKIRELEVANKDVGAFKEYLFRKGKFEKAVKKYLK